MRGDQIGFQERIYRNRSIWSEYRLVKSGIFLGTDGAMLSARPVSRQVLEM